MKDNERSAWEEYQEVDCPWFDPAWVRDHPEYPLATTAVEETAVDEEDH